MSCCHYGQAYCISDVYQVGNVGSGCLPCCCPPLGIVSASTWSSLLRVHLVKSLLLLADPNTHRPQRSNERVQALCGIPENIKAEKSCFHFDERLISNVTFVLWVSSISETNIYLPFVSDFPLDSFFFTSQQRLQPTKAPRVFQLL